jgi:energy-coupling factor transporter transmembrane protein EcfT
MQDSYMQVLADQCRIRLDPRTKIIMLLTINISAFTVNVWYVMALAAAIPLSLFLLNKRYRISLVFTLIYAFSLTLYIFLNNTTYGAVSIIAAMFTSVINRMGPGLLMGYYLLSTTTVSEFIAAMEKIRLPKQIIIPLSVMFRFFPTIKEESSSINDAMRMRGIRFGKSRGSLLALLEYRLVPLFISCVKIGEELSCSALTRGLGSPVKRTNICKIGFGFIDLLYAILTTVILLLFIRSKGA